MRVNGHHVELLCYGRKEGEWHHVEIAIDGVLATPFDVHAADWQNYPNDEARIQFLVRQAVGLVDTYGDARYHCYEGDAYAQART
jgi:hypothetical protein